MPRRAPLPQTSTMLERAFATAVAVGSAGTITAGCLIYDGYGALALATAMCVVLLFGAVTGVLARDALERIQRGELARVYALALSGKRDRVVEERSFQQTRTESLGHAFSGMAENLRLAMLGREGLARYAAQMQRAIESTKAQSQTLVNGLTEDALTIESAARGSRKAEAEFTGTLGAVSEKARAAEETTASMRMEAAGLADAVRAVTAEIDKATGMSMRLSETAHATQRGVTAMRDTAGDMLAAAEQLEAVMRRAEDLGVNASIEAARAGEAGGAFSVVAAEVRQLASSGAVALEQMLATVRDMRQQTGHVSQRIQEMSDVVAAQNEFGQALSHTAILQSDTVGRLLTLLNTANLDMRDLQAQVRHLTLPESRLGATSAAQNAVERLPSYAEAMGQILRSLPEIATVEKTKENI